MPLTLDGDDAVDKFLEDDDRSAVSDREDRLLGPTPAEFGDELGEDVAFD